MLLFFEKYIVNYHGPIKMQLIRIIYALVFLIPITKRMCISIYSTNQLTQATKVSPIFSWLTVCFIKKNQCMCLISWPLSMHD